MRKLVVFKAAWCGPCKMLTPVLKELKDSGYNIEIIDVDENAKLAEENNIKSVPTLDFFEGDKKYRRALGYQPKEKILAYLKEQA